MLFAKIKFSRKFPNLQYMSSVSLTERSISVLLHVFRYSYSSDACSNSTQDFPVPQRSSGVKKPEQRNVSHRLGPDFITMKPKIWGLSPLRKIAQPKSRKTCANRTLPKLWLDICKKACWRKKVKTVSLWKTFLSSIWVFTRQRVGLSFLAKYRDLTVEIFSQTHKVDISLYFHSSVLDYLWLFHSLNAFHFRTTNAHNFLVCERKHQVWLCIFLVKTYRIFWY